MILKIGRNDPCWCGSGHKFKKCHLARDQQPKANYWGMVAKNKAEFHRKRCLAEDQGLGDCKGKIVRAHTVSKSASLRKISEDSQVSTYKLNSKTGEVSLQKIGLNKASTFNGFCAKHDNRLFACLEDERFLQKPEQMLAQAYRILSRELYGKDAFSHIRETLRDADKGAAFKTQLFLQSMLDTIQIGNSAAQQEIATTHQALGDAISNSRFDEVTFYTLKFSAPLPFALAGGWSPFTDLHGDELQRGYSTSLLQQIMVSTFADETYGFLCAIWRDTDQAPAQTIVEQLIALPEEHRASALFQFSIKHIENVFYRSSWIESLSEQEKMQIDRLAKSGLDFLGSIPAAAIDPNVGFSLPSLA